MGACKPFTYSKITRQRFLAIRARIYAQATTTKILGDTGSATGQTSLGQMTAEWSYDESSQTLTVTVVQKPFLLSENLLSDKMLALVQSVNG